MFGKKSNHGFKEILSGIWIKTLNYGGKTLMTEFRLQRDAVLPDHSHENEQTGYLVTGKIKLFINGASRVMTPGDSWNVPSHAHHKAEVIEDTTLIEVFSPAREDYMPFIHNDDITVLPEQDT